MARTLTRDNAPKATRQIADLYAPAPISFSDLDTSKEQLVADSQPVAPARTPSAPKKETKTMSTNTSLKYLSRAIERETEPFNPNFERKLKPETKMLLQGIKLALARELKNRPNDPRAVAVVAAQSFKDNVQAYTTLWKNLLANAAFAAHMDCSRFERDVSADDINESLSGMLPPITGETPAFDAAESVHRGETREAYAGSDTPEPVATSAQDAIEAIEALQAWTSMAFSAFTPENAQFWGVDGLTPFGQRKDIDADNTAVYTPIRDFTAYREYQKEQWEAKRNRVDLPPDIATAMLGS